MHMGAIMKKIALLSDGWRRKDIYDRIIGAVEYIRDSEEEISIYQYNSFGNWGRDVKYNDGEYNIFTLPRFEDFDGVILECNSTQDRQVVEYLAELLKQYDGPVVSLNHDVSDFYYSGVDNKRAITELVQHLYEEHGCRTFAFAGGLIGNYENEQRRQAFMEAMEKFGIDPATCYDESRDWGFQTGSYHFERIRRRGAIPDAIVCANDNIAIGVCNEAEKYGLSAPKDFLVTGFDNLDKAFFFKPQLTTVQQDFSKIGETAMDIFSKHWSGKRPKRVHLIAAECIMTESCGCKNNGRADYRSFIKSQLIQEEIAGEMGESRVAFEGRMAEAENCQEILNLAAEYYCQMDCDGFYIVVDELLLKPEKDDNFCEQGYRQDRLVVGAAIENGEYLHFESVDALMAYLQETGAHSHYMFTPIHFSNQAVGYSILKNGRFMNSNPFFYDIHCSFVQQLEVKYRSHVMQTAKERLEEMYNRDTLTGLYNRIAYTELLIPRFEAYDRNGVSCALAFFDVDYFKNINDTLGHKYGDELLKKIAGILDANKPEDGIAYRFGGDEFVVFFPQATSQKVESYNARMLEAFSKEQISVSVGIIVTDPKSGYTIEEYMVSADKKMYEVKSARKNKK